MGDPGKKSMGDSEKSVDGEVKSLMIIRFPSLLTFMHHLETINIVIMVILSNIL